MLLVDDREHIPLREKIKRVIPTAEEARLPAADYLLFDQDGHSIGIERKEISDLLGSRQQQGRASGPIPVTI
jgi:ERCC4-type nuclease